MSQDGIDELNGSPKDPSGEGFNKQYIPTMMSNGALSPSPNVSSPMLYSDGAYPATSMLDNIKMHDKSSNIGLQKQNSHRPSTRFELAFQRRQPKSPKASANLIEGQHMPPREEKDSSSVLIPSKSTPTSLFAEVY